MTQTMASYRSPLHEMTQTTPTCLWNDSASIAELTYALEHGGVGATCNPVIVVEQLKREMAEWREPIRALMAAHPTATEGELAWLVVEQISVRAAALLLPVFEAHGGRNGRLSIQTDPRLYRDVDGLVRQAEHFASLAPNIIVKIPATEAGVRAMEEVTARGISVNATVSFTLPQAVAVAEAVERGLARRARDGHDTSRMGPVCTLMVGRLDDWLKVAADQQGISVDPGVFEWAGVAVFKKTYALFQQRGYRARLLSAAFRNHLHWSEFIGGDVVISPPHAWQKRYNRSDVPVAHRIDTAPEPRILAALEKFEDFRRANTEDGLTPAEFDTFPPTRRTMRQFIAACHELESQIRDVMIPNPDAAPR